MVYYHAAFPTPETRKMRKWGIITLVIFGTVYLLIRTGYNFIKNLNKFFAKGLRTLSNQILLLFICLSLLIVTYTYGAYDKILINWEYLIGTISIVILSWIIFCVILLVLALLVKAKWEELERSSVSFQHFKDKIREGTAIAKVKDSFEFLALKRFFFVPLFPVLKAMSLRQELKFSSYLELCLLRELRLFFKLSWTTWIALVFVMMFWNVFILPSSVLASTLFIMLIPLVGLIITVGLYLYTSLYLYRKVIVHIDSSNLSEYNDISYNSNELIQEMSYPSYLFNYIHDEQVAKNAKKKQFTIHEHMHQRPPSLYESIFIFGQSGPYIMLNVLQCCCFLLICWSVGTFGFFARRIISKYTKYAYIFLICGLIIYVALQAFFTIFALKWITIISSIEMKRNDKCVQKMINRHMKKISDISYGILNSFKKIYFDYKNQSSTTTPVPDDAESNNLLIDDNEMEVNSENDEFQLNYHNLRNFITLSFNRFNKMNPNGIDIKYELRPFLRTCGNVLNNEEMQFLLYLVSKSKNYSEILTLKQLYNICGILLHFREKKPYEIANFVFQKYYSDNNRVVYRVFKDENMKWNDIEVFLGNYQEYFDNTKRMFIEEQCNYLGEQFSLDSFISAILTPCQYHPY